MTAPYTGASNATLKMPHQADYRQSAIFVDQHGRDWSTEVDTKVKPMTPCAALTPAGWRAPFATLVPPQKYLTFPRGRIGVLVIDYDAWLVDAADGNREYDNHLRYLADKAFGAMAMVAVKNRDPDLLRLAGPSPAAIDFIRAMKGGNKWALGLLRPDGARYPMPPWAEPIADTLKRIETYDGSDVELDSGVGEYPDVEDDGPAEIAARLDDAANYLDIEDEIMSHEPVKRGRGRPRKSLTE